jgi:hypothetical protein
MQTTPSDAQLDDFIAAGAGVLDLPLEPQWMASIRGNLSATLKLALLIETFALPDEAEPAAVFKA